MTPFAAVLLAGGRSRRMGRDKALLPLPDGRPLWRRQLDVLRALEPAELFISGPWREGFPADVPLLTDATPGLGPLSGIAAALAAMHSPRLVALAVDLPAMTTAFLGRLLQAASDGVGVLPRHAGERGFYEPLVAVYPAACLPLAREHLRAGNLSLQDFVRAGESLLHPHTIIPPEKKLFVNWNDPSDLVADIGGGIPLT